MLELQKEHVGEPAFHERWAVAMVELDDPAQAITHLRVAALLYLDQEWDGGVDALRAARAGATLVRHLLPAVPEGGNDHIALREVLEEFTKIEARATEAQKRGDGAGRLHGSSI